jgi:glycosyltransferase involved in cell wall biosynthesis
VRGKRNRLDSSGRPGETASVVSRPKRLRVVTLLDTLGTGGAERMAVTIATNLDRERFEPSVCVYGTVRLALTAEIETMDLPILRLDRSHRAAVWKWNPLVQLLRRQSTHVLHSHKFGANLWGAIFGRIARVPVVVAHEHGSERDRFHNAVDRLLIDRGADAFIAVSEAERAHMIEAEGLAPDKVRVIRNGIDKLPETATDLRRDLGLPATGPVIGTLAVLRPEKALELLVEASALLAARFPGLRVLIAGGGPEEERLRSLISERQLEETVLLIGFRKDIADVLAALDVAVFSSDREAMPLAVIEAMAAGKAIVATRIDGAGELLRDGHEGLLVPPRDPAALAEGVARLLDDAALRQRLGSQAQERQRRELDIKTTVEAFEQLYDELYARSSRGRECALVPSRHSQAEQHQG